MVKNNSLDNKNKIRFANVLNVIETERECYVKSAHLYMCGQPMT